MCFKLFPMVGLASGTLAFAVLLAGPTAHSATAAARAQQVPPRPTLEPTATAQPTATPWPKPSAREDTTPRYGRVTGTVIDRRTGAPAANVRVMVGSDAVMSDANGNYDHWAVTGTYAVVLDISESQGIPAQAAQQVAISAEGTTVQHLFFSSRAPTAEAPALATVLPSTTPAPALASAPETVPERLPVTSGAADLPASSLWFAALLMISGGLLSIRRVRLALLPWLVAPDLRHGDSHLLGALLISRPQRRRKRATPKADAVLLESLLADEK